jgi:hypothetical protein
LLILSCIGADADQSHSRGHCRAFCRDSQIRQGTILTGRDRNMSSRPKRLVVEYTFETQGL